jgi:glycosyltransferase involved in cell wall biosynthesis
MPNWPQVVVAAPTWSLNGPNVFSANLVRGLIARQIPAHIVLTRPDWVDAKPLPRPLDIPFKTLAVKPFMSFRARCAAMIRHLEEHAPCIYIPNHDFGHSCISSKLPEAVAIIGIVHSDDAQHYDHLARLSRYWNAVVAVSPAIAAESLKIAPALETRLAVMPYGVEAAARLPERSGMAPQPLRVIYAGRLEQKQKRVLDLPAIFEAAADHGVPLELSIAGSGSAEGQLRASFAARGGGQRVEFLGSLQREALAVALARQDVFLLTSEFEGLPISLLEAMGQGCIPLVTNLRSGIPELIEDGVNGFRIPIGDIQGFARRLAELHRDPAMRRQMAEAAYGKATAGCYRIGHMVESYIQLFAQVLDEAKRGVFRRPRAGIRPPPDLPWPEHLAAPLQSWGHQVKQLLTERLR